MLGNIAEQLSFNCLGIVIKTSEETVRITLKGSKNVFGKIIK